MSKERIIEVNGKQLGKEDVYLDLSKLSKEELISLNLFYFYKKGVGGFLVYSNVFFTDSNNIYGKTEITYPQFLALIGESKPKYRFKTLEELDKEFEKYEYGEYIVGGTHFTEGMFHLAGLSIPDEFSEQIMNKPGGGWIDLGSIVEGKDNCWEFTPEMLTLNEQGTKNTQVEPFDNSEQLKTDSAENAQTGAENAQVGVVSKMENTEIVTDNSEVLEHAKKLLHSNGYFVFPKAPEGDFPDLSDFSGYKMIGQYGTSVYVLLKQGSSFMLDSGKIYDIIDLKPIQPELTNDEIVEKLGKDYLLNLIKEKENDKK